MGRRNRLVKNNDNNNTIVKNRSLLLKIVAFT